MYCLVCSRNWSVFFVTWHYSCDWWLTGCSVTATSTGAALSHCCVLVIVWRSPSFSAAFADSSRRSSASLSASCSASGLPDGLRIKADGWVVSGCVTHCIWNADVCGQVCYIVTEFPVGLLSQVGELWPVRSICVACKDSCVAPSVCTVRDSLKERLCTVL